MAMRRRKSGKRITEYRIRPFGFPSPIHSYPARRIRDVVNWRFGEIHTTNVNRRRDNVDIRLMKPQRIKPVTGLTRTATDRIKTFALQIRKMSRLSWKDRPRSPLRYGSCSPMCKVKIRPPSAPCPCGSHSTVSRSFPARAGVSPPSLAALSPRALSLEMAGGPACGDVVPSLQIFWLSPRLLRP
jgi:hypothetical protein